LPSWFFCIVQAGRVEVIQPDEEGKEVTLNAIGPGGFFGELALLDGGPRTATVRTTSASVFLTLGRDDFLKFLEKHPSAAIHVLSELGKRQRDMLQMLRNGVRNANQVMAERVTFGQRFADAFANRMGSWTFLIAQTTLITLWIIVNAVLTARHGQWDPYPFSLLSLLITGVAGYAAPIILMSQARQSEEDRIRAELEYQVNVKAHHEVMQLHQKIDRLSSLLEQGQQGECGSD
jgi:CRP/FNR family transcriptional regulator, cyclic AMP receptor protein